MQHQPSKKVKHTATLKNVHQEQLTKLRQKTQHETDLLDDIQSFSKQRSVIERDYGQAMAKLAQQYLSKHKLPPPPDLPSDDGQEHKRAQGRMVQVVWKSLLEMTEALGKHRLEAADTYLTKVSEPCKPIYMSKKQISKKVIDQATTLHKEITQSVQEMTKSHKEYNETEHVTHDVRLKAIEAEGKYKNKSTSIFTSLSTLQKNSAKLNAKRETHEVKSTTCRNQYLLDLLSANSHQKRFYETDLKNLMKLLDCDMNDRLREFLIVFSTTELHCSGFTQECFTKVMSDASLISEGYNLQCFLHDNPCFTNQIQYQFDATDGDEVREIVIEHLGKETMEKEAERCAQSLASDAKILKHNKKQLHVLIKEQQKKMSKTSDGGTSPPDKAPTSPSQDPEVKMEECRQNIRKAQTNKCKIEARLEAIRASGVNVDSILQEMCLSSDSEDEIIEDYPVSSGPVSKPTSNMQSNAQSNNVTNTSYNTTTTTTNNTKSTTYNRQSVSHSEASSGIKSRTQSVVEETQSVTNNRSSLSNDNHDTYINYEENDYIDETFPQQTESTSTNQNADEQSVGYCSGKNYPMRATVLYNFQATNADELTVEEGEELELTADGDGDGWVKAHNNRGQIGFVPENYINFPDENQLNGSLTSDQEPPPSAGYSTTPDPQSAGYQSSVFDSAPPSANYEQTEFPAPSSAPSSATGADHTSMYSATDYEVQEATGNKTALTLNEINSTWARALYAYEATTDEELTFADGALIEIIHKGDDVDDGWWKGKVDGKEGVFPSLVVEELGDAQKNMLSPMGVGPPAFTPPEPGPAPPQLEFTLPTPNMENVPETEGEETPLYGNSGKEGEKNDSSEGKDDSSAVDNNDDSSECKPESSKADDDSSNEKTADESSVNPDESPTQQTDESSPPKIERLTSEEDFPPPPAPEEFGQEQLNGDDVQVNGDDLPPPADDMIPPAPKEEIDETTPDANPPPTEDNPSPPEDDPPPPEDNPAVAVDNPPPPPDVVELSKSDDDNDESNM